MPSSLAPKIAALSDADALAILASYAGARLPKPPADLDGRALRAAVQSANSAASAAPATKRSEGDVARAALALVAEDPGVSPAIEAMVSHPPAKSFLIGEVAVLTLAVSVLMTRADVKKGPKGWEISLKKDALNTDQLKAFLNVVAGWFGK